MICDLCCSQVVSGLDCDMLPSWRANVSTYTVPKFVPAMQELSRFIAILLPDLSQKLQEFQVDPSIFASQWFLTLFVYNTPFKLVSRIWDIFFVKKWSIIYRVSIALLETIREDFVQSEDMEEILRLLKSISERVDDPDAIIYRAMELNLDEDDVRVLGNAQYLKEEHNLTIEND